MINDENTVEETGNIEPVNNETTNESTEKVNNENAAPVAEFSFADPVDTPKEQPEPAKEEAPLEADVAQVEQPEVKVETVEEPQAEAEISVVEEKTDIPEPEKATVDTEVQNLPEQSEPASEKEPVLESEVAEKSESTDQAKEEAKAPVTGSEVNDQTAKDENKEEDKHSKSARQKYFDEVFTELREKMDKKELVEVEIKARIRGGLRVHYKDLPMFLPTSHYILKRNPTEEDMQEAIGQKLNVFIHEYQEFDEGRKAIIVSRRSLLLEEIWNKIQVGDIVDGKVSSIASFGVFLEFDGIEGLIHISRLSKIHIDDPNKYYKKGQDLQAKIIEIDKEKNRIALSRKELEDSPWKGMEEEFKAGTQIKGIVRRLTDFGAYIELKPGVDGLLRNNELSWTKRVKKPSEILAPGQEIDIEILSISEEKENASLSYKRTQPNPWPELAEKYKIGSEFTGTVLQVIPQGAIVNISDDIDGFMPRSKMRPVMKGKKIPYNSGDSLTVVVSDINPAEESLILAPKVDEEAANTAREQSDNKASSSKAKATASSTFSLGDLLKGDAAEKLQNMNK